MILNGKIQIVIHIEVQCSKWFKAKFSFYYLEEEELENILKVINQNPLYVKVKNPMFGTDGILEAICYCSRVSVQMIRNEETGAKWGNLSFNVIQQKKVAGQ